MKKIPVAGKCICAALDLICWSIGDRQAEFLLSKIPGFGPPVPINQDQNWRGDFIHHKCVFLYDNSKTTFPGVMEKVSVVGTSKTGPIPVARLAGMELEFGLCQSPTQQQNEMAKRNSTCFFPFLLQIHCILLCGGHNNQGSEAGAVLLVPGGLESVPQGLLWAAPRGGSWDQCELDIGIQDGILMGFSCGREFKAPAALGAHSDLAMGLCREGLAAWS